jgi:hypothetical protein
VVFGQLLHFARISLVLGGTMPLCVVREHILQLENTFYNKRTHSIVREHILLGDVVPTAPARVPKYVPNASLMCPYQLPSEAAALGRYLSGVPNVFLLCSECVPNMSLPVARRGRSPR